MNDEDANGSAAQAVPKIANVSRFSLKFEWVVELIRNFLTVGFRNLRQQPFYSVLNILGLAVGIVCMLLAVMYVGHQLSFDRHHKKSDRIYRVIRKLQDTGGERLRPGNKTGRSASAGQISRNRGGNPDAHTTYVGLS